MVVNRDKNSYDFIFHKNNLSPNRSRRRHIIFFMHTLGTVNYSYYKFKNRTKSEMKWYIHVQQ
jgi:hypothetical protein